MPRLPELPEFAPEHYDRIVASFPGATGAEKATNYINWSINNLIDRVEMVERRSIAVDAKVELEARILALRASLPRRLPVADMPNEETR